jgi:hypothetical protein
MGRGRAELASWCGALFWLAWREGAGAFVARPDVETIEQAEVGIAHDLEAPQQRQAERAADSAGYFHHEFAAAQRLDTDFDARFFFGGFHYRSE